MPAGTSVTAAVLTEPPSDDAARRLLGGLPGPKPQSSPVAQAELAASASSAAPTDIVAIQANSDLLIRRDTLLTPPATYTSAVADSSVASIDQAIFHTFNWHAARSLDNGSSWTYLNPFTNFPATGSFAGGFCCNQRVTQDRTRDLVIWSLQYLKTNDQATGTNGIRIAVARGTGELAANTWQVHDFTPGQFGATYAQGYWFDYPGLAVSSNYLYFTYNLFTTTSDTWAATVIGRVPLNALRDNTPYTLDTFVTTVVGQFTLTPVSGATNRMFFGAVTSQNAITVVEWPESTTTPTLHSVTGVNSTYFNPGATCVAFDATDPCTNADTRMQTGWISPTELGFAWPSMQNPAVSRPYPFVRVAVLNPNSPATIISQPDLWSSSHAYLYPSLAVNARGHVGGVVDALGGTQGAGVAATLVALIRDDYSAGAWATASLGTSNSGTTGRWGHYNGSTIHDAYPNTWLAGGKLQLGGRFDADSRVHNIWLLRSRDDPFPFTDDPLLPGVVVVKAVHVTELRARIDAVRAGKGLPAYSWSGDVGVGLPVRALHIVEMREALRQAYAAAAATPPTYTDPSLSAGMTIRAAHITELRNAALLAP